MIDFPNAPTNGQIFTAPNGTQWTWDSLKWTQGATSSGFLPLTGGTMTGDIVLAHDPPAALNPATKQYVDAQNSRYRNRIINGDMSVDQRNGGALVAMPATTGYVIDRWRFGNPTGLASKGSYGQNVVGAPPANFPFSYVLTTQVSIAYPTAAAGDGLRYGQYVEGYQFNDAQWGTANAQPVVLEFWAATSAGTFAVAIQNAASTRSYVTTFIGGTGWTKYRINIPGDTGGTWAVAGNAAALILSFPLCVGSTYQTSTLNAWQAGNFLSTPGAFNVLSATSNAFNITGAALMVGAAAANAEPEFRKYSDNLIDCCRYYWSGQLISGGYMVAGAQMYGSAYFPAAMRASPTLAIKTNGSNNVNTPTLVALGNNNGAYGGGLATATGSTWMNYIFTADADF